jgi:hypothetical protein
MAYGNKPLEPPTGIGQHESGYCPVCRTKGEWPGTYLPVAVEYGFGDHTLGMNQSRLLFVCVTCGCLFAAKKD